MGGERENVMRRVAARSSSCSSWMVRSDLMGLEDEGDAFSEDHATGDATFSPILSPMKDARETFFGLAEPPGAWIFPSVCFEDDKDEAVVSRSRAGLGGRPLSLNHLLSGLTGVSTFAGPPHAAGLAAPLALSSSPRKNMVKPPFRVGCLPPEDCLGCSVRPDDDDSGEEGSPPSIGRNPTVLIGESAVSRGSGISPWGENPTIHCDVVLVRVSVLRDAAGFVAGGPPPLPPSPMRIWRSDAAAASTRRLVSDAIPAFLAVSFPFSSLISLISLVSLFLDLRFDLGGFGLTGRLDSRGSFDSRDSNRSALALALALVRCCDSTTACDAARNSALTSSCGTPPSRAARADMTTPFCPSLADCWKSSAMPPRAFSSSTWICSSFFKISRLSLASSSERSDVPGVAHWAGLGSSVYPETSRVPLAAAAVPSPATSTTSSNPATTASAPPPAPPSIPLKSQSSRSPSDRSARLGRRIFRLRWHVGVRKTTSSLAILLFADSETFDPRAMTRSNSISMSRRRCLGISAKIWGCSVMTMSRLSAATQQQRRYNMSAPAASAYIMTWRTVCGSTMCFAIVSSHCTCSELGPNVYAHASTWSSPAPSFTSSTEK